MNDHGTMTVELRYANETRHLCEYATPHLRRRLAEEVLQVEQGECLGA